MTSYVVLKKSEGGGADDHFWMQDGPPVDCVSAEAAVRKAVTDKGGTYVAIPLRSFQPLTVEVETKRTLRLIGSGD